MSEISELNRWIAENNYVLHRDVKEPRIVVVGEYDHYDATVQEKQLELARLLRPEYIFNEPFKNLVFSSSDRRLTEEPTYEKDKEAIRYCMAYQNPVSSEDRYTYLTSFSTRFLQEEGLPIEDNGRVSISDLESLVRNYGIEIELPEYIHRYFYFMAFWPFIKYCIDNDAHLVGCDLSFEDMAYRIGLFDKDSDIGALSMSPELNSDREQRAGNIISRYSLRTNKPSLSIHGNYHIRPKSGIFTVLNENQLDYMVVEQVPPKVEIERRL